MKTYVAFTNYSVVFVSVLLGLVFLFQITTIAQTPPVWVERFEGGGDNSDKYNAIAKDPTGNFIMAGYTYREGHQKDFLVVKVDANGDTLWTRYINGTNNGDDEAVAIAVDQAGNVYATGYTDGDKSNLDFLTVKYDAFGTQLWLATYNYSMAFQDDQAVAIALDNSGNVYVTGVSDQSITSASNKDYATIKYDNNGVEQFVARKNGFGNGTDEPAGIVADTNGNCYVTGRSDSGNDDDYITIKYNASGAAQWTKLYDGGNGDDRATAILLTNNGDVVVTGRKNDGSFDDLTTISYSANGVQLWIRNFNGSGNGNDRPVAMSTDLTGNIYVTGESDTDPSFNTNYDMVTLKIGSTGLTQWSIYFGSAPGVGNTDSPKAIATDNSGNVYVTGKTDVDASAQVNDDLILIKYDATGLELWNKTLAGTAIAEDGGYAMVIDGQQNPIIAGKLENNISHPDAVLLKYDNTGTLVFNKLYNGEGDFSENSFAIKTDQSGNVFIAGYTFNQGNNRDLMVKKYSGGGNLLKTFTYNGSKDDEDEASDMVLDATGNVYVTGYSKRTGESSDIITIKFNNNLDTSWIRFYNYSANESDKGIAITLDGLNNIFVTGSSDNNPSDTIDSDDIVTIKYDNNGFSQWINRYNGQANGDDKPAKIIIDLNGNAIVAGSTWNTTNYDFVTLLYNTAGAQQWAGIYNGIDNGNDKATALTADITGNIYVTGHGFFTGAFDDYVTIKYNQSGAQQWIRNFNGLGNDDDKAVGIAIDGNGNVFITGQSDQDPSALLKDYDMVTVKYDNNGNFGWSANFAGTSGTDDIPDGMEIDVNGLVYVYGQIENGSALQPDKDFGLISYFADGSLFFFSTYNGPVAGTDGINAMTTDGASVYVTGNSNGGVSQKDVATIKYNIPVGIEETSKNSTSNFIGFPNPAIDFFTISNKDLDEKSTGTNDCIVFDVTGKKLAIPIRKIKNSFVLKVKDVSAGVYGWRIINKNRIIASGKFVK